MKRVFVVMSAAVAMVFATMRTARCEEGEPASPSPGQRFFKALDKDSDGKISKEEAPQRLKTHFDKIDADSDGGITPEELKAAFNARLKPMRDQRPGGGNRPGLDPKWREGVQVLRDIEYAKVGDVSLKLDLYIPRRPNASGEPPLIAWIHGGAWRAGSKSGVNRSFARLTANGYAVASIDYRLNGLTAHPEHIHDCKGAIRFLRANADKYNYNATRIGVGGGSAGGHLVALLGTSADVKELEGDVGGNLDQSSRVQAVVDLFGPADFEFWASQSERFGANKNPKLLKSGSPVTYVTQDDAPLLIFHGDRDTTVPISQSQRLHKLYQDTKLESAFHTIEGAGHGGGQFSDDERHKLIKAFLDKHIKQVKASP